MTGTYQLTPLDTFVLSIIVLFLGMTLTRKGKILAKYNIPPAVTGGLICSIIVAIVSAVFDIRIRFDMQIRDFLLLTFFSCIGLGAKLEHLRDGGKALAILVGVAAVFLVVQDLVGIGLAFLFGGHPALGVIAGTVTEDGVVFPGVQNRFGGAWLDNIPISPTPYQRSLLCNLFVIEFWQVN